MRFGTRRAMDIGLVLAGVAALVINARRSDPGVPVAVVLATLTCLPWLGHERFPMATLLASSAGVLVCIVVLRTYNVAPVVAGVLLFSVALSGDRRRSLAIGAVAAVVLAALLAALIPVLERTDDVSGGATRVLLVLGALVLGDLVRSRRGLRSARREQAASAERELRDRVDSQAAAERLRIARELHDTLAHALVAINVRAGVTAHLGAGQDTEQALTEIKEVSAQALTDLRATLDVLRDRDSPAPRDPALDLQAVPQLVQRARAAGLRADAELALNGASIPSVVGQAGFRIVQESLTNVMRHARASETQVRIAAHGDALMIEVTDDGQGAVDGAHAGGHGLRGMSERAAAVGGEVTAGPQPQPQRGWRVMATLPLNGHRA
jgi:signal transduction histidine kinase